MNASEQETAQFKVRSCCGEDDEIALSVDINHDDTLVEVRAKLLDEYEDDSCLPDSPWAFYNGDVFVSKKQEQKKRAWDLLNANQVVRVAKSPASKKIKSEAKPEEASPLPDRQESHARGCEQALRLSSLALNLQDTNAENLDSSRTCSSTTPSLAPVVTPTSAPRSSDNLGATTAHAPAGNAAQVRAEESADQQKHSNRYCIKEPLSSVDYNFRNSPENPHKAIEEALEECTQTLQQAKDLLDVEENKHFCSEAERNEFSSEVLRLLDTVTHSSHPPKTVAVLGRIGEGKSSLLNALLDEAEILPTSGCRGCTATAVELSFNRDLDPKKSHSESTLFPVYKAEIEFIDIKSWLKELEALLGECCGDDGRILASPPRGKVAVEAWQKLNSVYGKGTMEDARKKKKRNVYRQLASEKHIHDRISQRETIVSGSISRADFPRLFAPAAHVEESIRLQRREWAKSLRKEIDTFMHGTGNDDEPQMWPLIQKVMIQGPWSVLSSGACLVDLPGLQDSNCSRGAVTDHYLKNCDHILVVAKIQRAVNDGTAHKLLGTQLRRQLILDGTHRQVSFVCTMTDDLETSESRRDLADFAQNTPTTLAHIRKVDSEVEELEKRYVEKANPRREQDSQNLSETRQQGNLSVEVALAERQKELKELWSGVRNEYSKETLKKHFRPLLNRSGYAWTRTGSQRVDQVVTDLEVFTVSANDYLKLLHIKPSSDGQASTFSGAHGTEIPKLKTFIHLLTSQSRKRWARDFIIGPASELFERMDDAATKGQYLLDAGGANVEQKFKASIETFHGSKDEIVAVFARDAKKVADRRLVTTMEAAATNARDRALGIVDSWARYKRCHNGGSVTRGYLHFNTYKATVAREGVYNSPTAGYINFNRQLTEPMQKHYYKEWEKFLGRDLHRLVRIAACSLSPAISAVTEALQDALPELRRFASEFDEKAKRRSSLVLRRRLHEIKERISRERREVNRIAPTSIARRMKEPYLVSSQVEPGAGTYKRMRKTLHENSKAAIESMYDDAKLHLVDGLKSLIRTISKDLIGCFDESGSILMTVFSALWGHPGEAIEIPSTLLGELRQLREKQSLISEKVGLAVACKQASSDESSASSSEEGCTSDSEGSFNGVVDSSDESYAATDSSMEDENGEPDKCITAPDESREAEEECDTGSKFDKHEADNGEEEYESKENESEDSSYEDA